MCVTKRPFLDQENLKPEIPVIIFGGFFFSFNYKEDPTGPFAAAKISTFWVL